MSIISFRCNKITDERERQKGKDRKEQRGDASYSLNVILNDFVVHLS